MFDISIFAEVAVAGVPLLFVVMGLVQYIKEFIQEFNAPPWVIRLISMAVGLVFGGGYMIDQFGAVPASFGDWFALVVYGFSLGLVASGIYQVGENLAEK